MAAEGYISCGSCGAQNRLTPNIARNKLLCGQCQQPLNPGTRPSIPTQTGAAQPTNRKLNWTVDAVFHRLIVALPYGILRWIIGTAVEIVQAVIEAVSIMAIRLVIGAIILAVEVAIPTLVRGV